MRTTPSSSSFFIFLKTISSKYSEQAFQYKRFVIAMDNFHFETIPPSLFFYSFQYFSTTASASFVNRENLF